MLRPAYIKRMSPIFEACIMVACGFAMGWAFIAAAIPLP